MQKAEYNELAGRVDGLSRAVLFLIADAEEAGLIEGHDFTARLRLFADALQHDQPGLAASKRTMRAIADQLDESREFRG